MSNLTSSGEKAVEEISRRHELSKDSVIQLLEALGRGNGTMAQFQCPEFGSGQWMQGGMTMVGDMFNHSLKARVGAVFNDLAAAMSRDELFTKAPKGTSAEWWPPELGTPSGSGSQNEIRYAIFPGPRRLAILRGGDVTVYDTGSHRIGGISQQQGASSRVEFSSQLGSFPAESLPVVSGKGKDADIKPKPVEPSEAKEPVAPDVAATLRKLGELRDEGLLTEEEFAAKRKQVIDRI